MNFGFYVPNFGFCGEARVLADLAREAEDAGWDGFFIWDHLQVVEPAVDPWVALTAMALSTRRIRLGPLVTPVPRRHIAKLAREVTSLDHLSNGRLILGVGAGFPALPDYAAFGDRGDAKERAARLDEGLDLLAALWSGEPVKHAGVHFQVDCAAFQPPLQRPRPPIWVAAAWPAQRPLARAARWDGVVPVGGLGLEVDPTDLPAIVAAVQAQRFSEAPFDVTQFGVTRDPDDTRLVAAAAQAGATWWIDYVFARGGSLEATRRRLRQGPPRL